jgi:hypothetical protein
MNQRFGHKYTKGNGSDHRGILHHDTPMMAYDFKASTKKK